MVLVFLMIATPSTTTLFTFGRALRTTASVPLSLPAITRTLSPFLQTFEYFSYYFLRPNGHPEYIRGLSLC